MDGWTDRGADSQIDGLTNRGTDWWMDGVTDRWIDRQTNGLTDIPMDRQMDRWTDRQMDKWTDRQTNDRRTDRWMDSQTDRQKIWGVLDLACDIRIYITNNKHETEFWRHPRSDAINNNLRPVAFRFPYSLCQKMGFDRQMILSSASILCGRCVCRVKFGLSFMGWQELLYRDTMFLSYVIFRMVHSHLTICGPSIC